MDIGLLFDWDGVVIDSSRQHEQSWHLLADEIGETLPEGYFKATFGMKNQEIIPTWLPHLRGDVEKIQALGDRKEALYREIIHREGIAPLPGIQPFLAAAKKAGIPASVGSSTPRANIDAILHITGLGDLFQAIVCAEDVQQGKPHPDVFLKGAERLQRAPERCIVFEDAFVGIQAGKTGGMKVVGIATTHPLEALTQADLAVLSLEGIDPVELANRLGL
jgi:beta-phosphoglucomutase family hydrolase